MHAVTGYDQLVSVELELKKGVIFNSSGCCASGSRTLEVFPTEMSRAISEELDSLDIDALAAELAIYA